MKTTILLSIFFGFFFISCDNEDDKQGVSIIASQHFFLLNEKGEDLLDPDNKEGIDLSKLKIFYLVNGEKMEAVDYNRQVMPNVSLNYPYGYRIAKHDNPYYHLVVFLNDSMLKKDGTISYTYIEWDKDDVDTITAKNTAKGTRFESRMIKFNDTNWAGSETEIFTIIR